MSSVTTNFESLIQSTKTEQLVLDDIVGDVLKVSFQYIIILLIILVLVYNFYISYFFRKTIAP
jgi:hypothetical protein